MRAFFKPLLAALLAVAFIGGAGARELTGDEVQQLEATVAQFDTAMRDQDHAILVGTIPPRVLDYIAEQSGVEVDTLREVIVQQMTAALATVEVEAFSIDLDAMTRHELPDGEPYVLVPTETVMNSEATGRMVARSETLGVLDEGTWYLLRVNDSQQVAILRQVYPQFASVEFPQGTMEAAE